MDIKRKRELVENYTYTYRGGIPCSVGGWKNHYAGIMPATGQEYGTPWEVIERAAATNGDIPEDECWHIGNVWIGYMTWDEARKIQAQWRKNQQHKAS